jgi:two-component system, cell cycle sensor histidine kinase and response regulator CckA
MGKTPRLKTTRLPEKLLKIRTSLGLSQNELIRRLGLTEQLFQASISGYELGTREPALPILLKYGQVAGVCLDALINDQLNLPEKLPNVPKHQEPTGVSDSRSSHVARDLITSLATHLEDGLIMIDHTGHIIFVNESATAISGYPEEEIVGQPLAELFPPGFGKQGQSHPLGLPLQSRGTVTYHSKPLGKEIELTIIPVEHSVEASESPVHAVIVLRGKSAASESVGDDPQTARMRLMGQLTMGIAHDFNNALTSIICNTQLVGEIFEQLTHGNGQTTALVARERARAHRYLDDITRVSRKAATFIRTLLAYARQQQLAREPIDLNEAVADTVYLTRKLVGERVTTNFRPGNTLSLIYAERSQIDQVLWNLLLNARDAMPDGGDLLVETASITLDQSFTATREWARPGNFVRLSVSDTGIGMDQETLKKIFDPFFTTKAEGQGSGLGLATVYGIVKQHNGYIDVQSESGNGTRFDIYLPLAEAHQRPLTSHSSGSARAASQYSTRKSLIIVAEDDENVRVLFRRIISRSGGRVITVNAGDKALKLFRKLKREGNQVDLVILDVGLPGMDGRTVCQKIHAIDREVPVLLTSGYGIPFKQDQSITEEGYEFLAKPFDGAQLLARIEQMLQKRPTSDLA